MSNIVLVLHRDSDITGGKETAGRIRSAVPEHELAVLPQFAGTDDPELSRYVIVQVPSQADPERVAERLRGVDGVDGAYVQPEAKPAQP